MSSLQTLSPFQLLGLVAKDYRRVLKVATLVTLGSVALALFSPPEFEAAAVVQVGGANAPDLQLLTTQVLPFKFESNASSFTETELIRLRSVVSPVVLSHRLHIVAEPRRVPLIGKAIPSLRYWLRINSQPWYAHWAGRAWGEESIKVDRFDVPMFMRGERFLLTLDTGDTFSLKDPEGLYTWHGQVGVAQQWMTPAGPVEIKVDEIKGTPGTVYRLKRLNEIKAVDELRNRIDVSELGRTSGVLELSFMGPNPDFARQVLGDLTKAYVAFHQNRIVDDAKRLTDYLTQEVPRQRELVEAAERRLNDFKIKHGTLDLTEATRVLMNEGATANHRLVDTRLKAIELRAGLINPSHPAMVQADQWVKEAEQAAQEVARRIQRMPSLEREAVALLRDVMVQNEVYEKLVLGQTQHQINLTSKVARHSLVDPASITYEPTKSSLMIIALGALCGLFLGLMWSLLRRQLPFAMEDTLALEGRTDFPVITHLGSHSGADRMAQTPDQCQSGLRTLLGPIEVSVGPGAAPWSLFCGPHAGVGTSHVARRVAECLGQSGPGRVLLVDANPGRQSLSAWFGLEHAAGLSDGLKQSGDWVGLVQAQIRPGLDLLCGGRQIMHPKDLWTHPRWAPLLSELANGYDHVVIDGPTGVNLLGAKEVLPRMSGIFVVARRLRTRENDLIEMVRQLQGLGGHVSRIVFNESTLAGADSGAKR